MSLTHLSFHEWQIVVHTYNGVMPHYCFVLYSGEGMSNFCIKFQAYCWFKSLCDVIFSIAEVYHKWLYLSFEFGLWWHLHFCFSSGGTLTINTCSSVFVKILGLVGAYTCMSCFSARWSWYFFSVLSC